MAAYAQRREPVLDGVRGIAILLVLFHHFVIYSGLPMNVPRSDGLDWYLGLFGRATWLGVDVFFVLSGFLITGILYDTKSAPGFFRTFYGRRTVRIFPLYYGVLAVVFFAAPALFGLAESGVEGGQIWYWTYLSNVDIALNGWRQPLEIGHFWSLAVEEQFYLIWPVVVFAAGRRRLLGITLTCFGLALLLRWIAPIWLPALSVYVLMPMRMDALAAGAFLALAVRGPRGWAALGAWPRVAFVLSSLLLGTIFYWRRGFRELDPVVRTLGYSGVAVCTAALIAIAMTSREGSPLRRILGSSWLRAFGTYSYGLYVFHHIVVLTLRGRGFQADLFPTLAGSHVLGFLAFGAVGMTLSGVLAYVSWHAWEMPFLRLKRYFQYRRPGPVDAVVGPPSGALLPQAGPPGLGGGSALPLREDRDHD